MNLDTAYMGLKLKSPLVASASPLSKDLDGMKKMEDGGAAAIVMFSLFEEQIIHESASMAHYLDYGAESYAEALSYFPEPKDYNAGPGDYLKLIGEAKRNLSIPVIASLNGLSTGGWTDYAKEMESAGADGIELNIYYIPTDPNTSGADIERRYIDVVKAVKAETKIPIAVKLGPYFSSTANMAKQLADVGADALVLFNRFYEPDFDLDEMAVKPSLVLSAPQEMRLPLHWIAILYGRVPVDLAVSSGVHSHLDVLKSIMAGANVATLTSNILRRGAGRFREILTDLTRWMEEHEYESIEQMRGSMSQQHIGDPLAYERANYMKELQSFRPDPSGLGLA